MVSIKLMTATFAPCESDIEGCPNFEFETLPKSCEKLTFCEKLSNSFKKFQTAKKKKLSKLFPIIMILFVNILCNSFNFCINYGRKGIETLNI